MTSCQSAIACLLGVALSAGPACLPGWCKCLHIRCELLKNTWCAACMRRSTKTLQLLQEHIRTITSRVNTLTGVAYKDDPTIIGYNLLNEPR